MKKKNLIVFGLMLTLLPFSSNVSAQAVDTSSKNHYYETSFGDNWYISAGAGVNLYMLQDVNGIKPKHPLTFIGGLAVGKWFTPYLGLRLEADYGDLRIYHGVNGVRESKKVGYFGVYGDLTWNLSNTFWGYNENRIVDIIPFGGISYLPMVKDNFYGWKAWELPISLGLKVNFKLSHLIDIFIQDRFTFTTTRFNAVGDNKSHYLEPIMSLTGGITFKLGQNRFTAYNPYEEALLINSLNDKINVLRQDLDKCLSRKCLTEADVKKEIAQDCPPCDLNSVVRFRINSAVISREQQVNVFNAAEWMKKHPKAVIEVVGFADKDTGTPEYNMELSMRRAQAVAKELTSTYKIDSNRIKVIAKGSTEQPYPQHNDWNRVVLFVNEHSSK